MSRAKIFACLFFSTIVSCGGVNSEKVDKKAVVPKGEVISKEVEQKNRVKLTVKSNDAVSQGESVTIECTVKGEADSVVLFIRNKRIDSVPASGKWVIPTDNSSRVGVTNYKVVAYKDGLSKTTLGRYTVTSNVKVKKYKARAVKSFPHNRLAYTQGLEFYNGKLLESSGEYGKSFIHIMDFPSMKTVEKRELDAKYFAEGVTVLDGKAYLITWRENKCYILDTKTLEIIAEKSFNGEGWGITNDGKRLYMSDGSQYIYILDPKDFKQVDKLEVMLEDEKVLNINELEWIDGEIWANIYTTDDIVKINPKTGAVTAVIDAAGLLDKGDYIETTDVLNGIAKDNKSGKIYLTGKNWPKLFEVDIVEANE